MGIRAAQRFCTLTRGHSPWVSRYLTELGHEVIVANARRGSANYRQQSEKRSVRCQNVGEASADRSGVIESDSGPQLASPSGSDGDSGAGDVSGNANDVGQLSTLAKSYGERLLSCGTGQVGEELAGPLSEPLQKIIRSRQVSLMLRTNLSACAFRFGDRGGNLTDSASKSATMFRNSVVNRGSRSWIK